MTVWGTRPESDAVSLSGLPEALAVSPATAPGALPRELAFLEGRHADRESLMRTAALARRWRVSPENAAFASGLISPEAYYRALAAHIGLHFARLDEASVDWRAFRHPKGEALARARIVPLARLASGLRVAIAPGERALRRLIELAARPDAARTLRDHLFLATPRDIGRAIGRGFNRALLDHATTNLARTAPAFSAAGGLSGVQRGGVAAAVFAVAGALYAAPLATLAALNLLLSVLFATVGLARVAACLIAARRSLAGGTQEARPARMRDEELPVYTLLVPLFREGSVLPHLIDALMRLDYPPARLDIRLILEEADTETLAAARALRLPEQFEIFVVPEAQPRTKPRALNYALQTARGELVAVYDAEDRPDPDQLRRAAARFARGDERLACVQARLGIYNGGRNWLTRQFAIEYAGLFDALLPALHALRLPIPLGGTSNHFRRAALEAAGAWDPFNVTEDADLGIRLARLGYSCAVMESHTYEEACSRLRPWLRQRTRWLKGWLQTWFVHMRHPVRLARDLGPAGFAAFNLLIGGMVLAGLSHPLFLGFVIYSFVSGLIFAEPASSAQLGFAAVNMWNLTVGYAAAIALGWIGLQAAGQGRLARNVAWVPLYWVLISLAAWRALWQFLRARHHWEKTDHALPRFTLARQLAPGADAP